MTHEELKPGDQVQLLSGGPAMTVRKSERAFGDTEKYVITCEWFAGKKLESGKFAPETLKPIDGAQKKS